MKRFYLWVILPLLLAGGCQTETHFITDAAYRRTVEEDFEVKKQILSGSPENLFAVFDSSLTTVEREALQFLYAYSPLIDLTGDGGKFLLANVRHSLKVKQEMPWGKEMPEAIFRHFVLPVRGSNESLDSSRMVFHRELRDRVLKCSTMEEAALEVNHWCHEKAIYKPTNARTCSPLAMMSMAYGRCGEESVFTLAALRSVGIPARQVYTPRWAHCDDNHAWIEVWVDGKWKYLGACEPEPRLDIAWFTAPVRRGVLMLARVFGKYESDEEVASENANGTVVNVTGNYTAVKKMVVRVTDTLGNAVPGAKVQYRIYNYGEYYPVASLTADGQGRSGLTGGLGDWIVWASFDGRYGFAELQAATADSVTVVLNQPGGVDFCMDYELTPPAEKEYDALVPDEERAVNDKRFMYEDSVRAAYIATFPDSVVIDGVDDQAALNRYIKASRGNYGEIIRFLRETEREHRAAAMELLGVILEKDLQDTPAHVLKAHLDGAFAFRGEPRYPDYRAAGFKYHDLYRETILNPRVKNELLTAWRQPLLTWLMAKNVTSPEELIRAMENIRVVDSVNTVNIETPPTGVMAAMVTDSRSKNLFFVAACRTMGIAARLNPVDGKPEYHVGKAWTPVVFSPRQTIAPKGQLMVRYDGKAVKSPSYYTHFTISKLNNGQPRTIDLGSNSQVDMGGGASYQNIFKTPVTLEEGDYILTTGNRRGDGAVLSQIKSFTVKAGQRADVDMIISDAAENLKTLGVIDTKIEYRPEDGGALRSLVLPKRGYTALALIAANKEPTNHLIRDMSVLKTEFEEKGVPMAFLFADSVQMKQFSRHDFRPLPSVMNIGCDQGGRVMKMLEECLQLKNAGNLPLIVMVNGKGEVVFISQGYRVGLGTQIMKVMNYE